MRITRAALAAAVAVSATLCLAGCGPKEKPDGNDMALWPEIEPYDSGYLRVSDLHEIHYRVCGSPEGVPVFVLHGGPGAACWPYYRRFFNPEKYMIVLHDQRGCGMSRPSYEIRENTTQYLVEDIEALRKHLGLEKVILFGGSWGTTLALAYAETYPQNVHAMVLRGVFLSTDQELQHYYNGGTRHFFPEAYDRLAAEVAEAGLELSPQNLFTLIHERDEASEKKYCIAWIAYESGISRLDPQAEDVEAGWNDSEEYRHVIRSMGLLENYYMANRCFLKEGQLLSDADRIAHIPAFIINGRYDSVCPPVNAYLLHEKLPLSRLTVIPLAGHSMSEPLIEKELLRTMIELEGRFH